MERGLEQFTYPKKEQKEVITLDKMFSLASRLLKRNAIDPKDFVDIYGKEAVSADKREVGKLRKTFEVDEAKKLATVLESLVIEHVNRSDWLGRNAEAKPTAPYDDYINGIDSLIILKNDDVLEKYMGLVMDITFAKDDKTLTGKFNTVRGEVVRGRLGTIKYFQSPNSKGEMTHIPKVIIGVERKTVEALGKLKAEGRDREISRHPVQFQILEEMEMQLRALAKYAETQPNDMFYEGQEEDIRGKLVEIYKELHKSIIKILEERRQKKKDNGERDQMFYLIKEKTERFFK